MKILLNAQNFTEPTLETLRQYSQAKFRKLLRVTPKKAHYDPVLQISARYSRNKGVFEIKAVLTINRRQFIFKVDDKDLRRAVDLAETNIRRQILNLKGKRWQTSL